jgi:hypothetical protein
VTEGNGSVGYRSCKKRRTVLSTPLVRPVSHRHQPAPSSPFSGNPTDASFEAELLARTRHCQLFLFDHTASSLPRALSTPASLPIAFGEFYSARDVSSSVNEHDYWDSRGTTQRSHFKPYHIADFDAHATGDKIKTYTLESLMRQNGARPRVCRFIN